VSHDARDKLMACLHWWYGRYKDHPDYVKAPFYFDAVYQWHQRFTLDGEELVGTVIEIYNAPRYGGEKVALQYAEDLPAVPPWPFQ